MQGLRVFSDGVEDLDVAQMAHASDSSGWVIYTDSRILNKMSDGSEFGHGIPHLIICLKGSHRRILICSESFLGNAIFKSANIKDSTLCFILVSAKSGNNEPEAKICLKLFVAKDLNAPFIEDFPMEVLP